MKVFNLDSEQQKWVDGQFNSMTVNEKIGQLVCENNNTFLRQENPKQWLCKYPIGSTFLGSEIIDVGADTRDRVKQGIDAMRTKKGIPVLFCGDFEHGIGSEIEGFTRLPDLMALGATFDEELASEYGRIIAEEGRLLDIRWSLGPVADLNLNRDNPVTNIRSIGDNPGHAVKMLTQLVDGMQSHGMAACIKHFPGDGTDTRNQHQVTSLNLLSKEQWDQQHGKVFKSLIDAGAVTVMIGHMGFPALEPVDEKKGIFRPATASKRIMTDLLRGELGFEGIILTDALSMCGFQSWGDYDERIIDSFDGGTDIFLWPRTELFFELMNAALTDGRASMKRLDESVRRILGFKAWLGLDGKPREVRCPAKSELAANNKFARKVAKRAVTLLRNRSGDLPLQLSGKAKILMFYTPEKDPAVKHLEYFKQCFTKAGHDATMHPLSTFTKDNEYDVERYDAVFLLCNARPLYGDYRGCNNFWRFMACRTMKKRIIISFGTPYFLYDVASADSYVNAYSDCENAQQAVFDALFGRIPFEGKSPVGVEHCFSFGDRMTLVRRV